MTRGEKMILLHSIPRDMEAMEKTTPTRRVRISIFRKRIWGTRK